MDLNALASTPLTFENVLKMLQGASPEVIKEIEAKTAHLRALPWLPQAGPQTAAFDSPADETLYGGAAGGGKTDLLLGLATTAHQRTVIFRSQSVDLRALWDRLQEIIPNPAKSDASTKSMRLRDGRRIETGHLDLPGSERAWMGRPHDLIGFDEAALLHELKVNFVMQWLRSGDPKQRCRVVFATNPPLPEINADGSVSDTAVGDWLLRWFAPWVDDTFARPAKEGELRWCFMRQEGDRLTTVWVDGPGAYDPESGEPRPNATKDDINNGRVAVAKSRTFIRSLVSDNIFYANSGYAERLSGMPEPMKSMLLKGDFTIKGMDHPFQIIPTEWVLRAQARWAERSWKGDLENCRQLVLYGDIAQGGADTTVLSPLYETDFFEELTTAPGAQTPTGVQVQTMILTEREDDSIVALDGTGGWAGSTRDLLKTNQGIECEMHIASASDGSWDSKNMWKFENLRAKMWWEFREALSPKSGYDICLPPSARLRAQLTAPQYKVKGQTMTVESKDDIRKRIGSSTDEADAVLGAWQYRDQAIARIMSPSNDIVERLNGRAGPLLDKKRDRQQTEIDNYDPRGDW